MNYLTNYYKTKAELLEKKINALQKNISFTYGGFPVSRKTLNEQNTPGSGSIGGRNRVEPGSFTNPIDYLRGGGTQPTRFPQDGEGDPEGAPLRRRQTPGSGSIGGRNQVEPGSFVNPIDYLRGGGTEPTRLPPAGEGANPMTFPLSNQFPEGSYPEFVQGQWYVIVGNQYVPAGIQNGQWVPLRRTN